jgi:N6-adenosine-specific RNA methylase IME4
MIQPYRTILCDPPWRTRTWSAKGRDRCPDGPRGHYATMALEELQNLPIANLAAPSCRLFLWTIDSHLPQALALGAAWGFSYSTVAFVWAKLTKTGKPAFGGGHVTRKGAELCLLFLKGKLARRSAGVRQVIFAKVREHSRKPDEAYARIEQLVDGPYLELFARSARPGWDAMGDELGRWDAPRQLGAGWQARKRPGAPPASGADLS